MSTGLGREGRIVALAGDTGMNTTRLIKHWSMGGARRDLEGRFRSTDDIRSVMFRALGSQPSPVRSELLMKGTDEDDWRPLVVGASEA